MRKIYDAKDAIYGHLVQELLDESEIPAVVQGQPPFISVWVSESVDQDAAKLIVDEFEARQEDRLRTRWKCEVCGDINDGTRSTCLKCDEFHKEERGRITYKRYAQFMLLINISSAFLVAGMATLLCGKYFKADIRDALEMFQTICFVATGVVFLWAMFRLVQRFR